MCVSVCTCTHKCVNHLGGRSGSGGGLGLRAAEPEEEGPAFQMKIPETPLTYILAGSGTFLRWLWEELPGGGTSVTRLLSSLDRVAPSLIKNPG